MKILFWMFSGFDRHITSEHLLIDIIEQLCQQGHEVHILQEDTGGDLPHIPVKLKDYSLTTTVLPYHTTGKGNLRMRYLAECRYVYACKKYMLPDYDAVFIQSNPVAGVAIRLLRRRIPYAHITLNIQDIFPYNAAYSGKLKQQSLTFKILSFVQRYGYTHADRLITISEDMKDLLVQDGIEADKVKVIYNWSYQDEPYNNNKMNFSVVSHLFSKEYFNVVYAGNIGVMQNVDILVEAAKLMKDDKQIWFHIIGDGVYKEKLMQKAKAYGLNNLSFWPMQPPELAPVIYSAADINVIPLAKDIYKTALPSKTATCLACGKPIIFAVGRASRFGKKLMQNTGCLFIESDNPAQLVAAIKKNQEKRDFVHTEVYFKHHFQKTKNAARYAQIIATYSAVGR